MRPAHLARAFAAATLASTIASAQVPPAAPRVTAAPGRGLTVSTADERFSLNLRARVQLRGAFTFDETSDSHDLGVRTLRLYVQGHLLSPSLRYTVQLALGAADFEPGNASPIFDAYLEHSGLRDLTVRVGQFFVPFDRARTIREFALQLVDRPQVVRELTLDRDLGVMLSSNDLFGLGGRLGYALFVGLGAGRNRFGASHSGPLATARLMLRPWGAFDDDQEGDLTRQRRLRLALGVAAAFNHDTARVNGTTGAAFTLGTVDQRSAAVDLVVKYAGFSLLAEAVLRRASVDHLDGTPTGNPPVAPREWTRSALGYFAQLGAMLTDRVELVGRWEQLVAWDGNTDPALLRQVARTGRQFVGGANLYLNGHLLKLQADYSYLFGDDPSGHQHLVRLQLDATF